MCRISFKNVKSQIYYRIRYFQYLNTCKKLDVCFSLSLKINEFIGRLVKDSLSNLILKQSDNLS
jgi:hypothetical protein